MLVNKNRKENLPLTEYPVDDAGFFVIESKSESGAFWQLNSKNIDNSFLIFNDDTTGVVTISKIEDCLNTLKQDFFSIELVNKYNLKKFFTIKELLQLQRNV